MHFAGFVTQRVQDFARDPRCDNWEFDRASNGIHSSDFRSCKHSWCFQKYILGRQHHLFIGVELVFVDFDRPMLFIIVECGHFRRCD